MAGSTPLDMVKKFGRFSFGKLPDTVFETFNFWLGCGIIQTKEAIMPAKESSRNVNAKEALECIRGSMSNTDIMEKFRISPLGYADLLKQLYLKKLISEEDMVRRGIRFKIAKPQMQPEKSHEQDPVIPNQPVQYGEEFLDTVELTELLSFKNLDAPKEEGGPEEIPPPSESDEKKSRFSISGIFKKAR